MEVLVGLIVLDHQSYMYVWLLMNKNTKPQQLWWLDISFSQNEIL